MATARAENMRTTGRAWGGMTRRLAGPGTGRSAPWAAVRTAVALALPLCIGLATDHAELGTLAALSALFTAIIEPGGGYLRHAQVYGLVALVNVGVVAMAIPVTGHPLAAGLAMLALGIAAGLVTVWGSVATLAAPCPLILFIATEGIGSGLQMGPSLLAVAAGSGWVVLISIVPWPLAPYAPAEIAVGDAWHTVADLARDPSDQRRQSTALSALEVARDTVSTIRSRRGGWSHRGHRLWATLVAGQRVVALLGAVADDRRREPAPDAVHTAMSRVLREVADAADEIARNAHSPRRTPDLAPLAAAVAGVRAASPDPEGLTGPGLHRALTAAGRCRAAARLEKRIDDAVYALDLPDPPDVRIPHRAARLHIAPLRAALTWRSTALRHGVRLGVATGISVAIFDAIGPMDVLGVTHGFWVTITLAGVLRPTLGDSVEYVIQRAVGTAAGAALAAVLISVLGAPWLLVVAAVIAGGLAALLAPINYAWFVVLFTPLVLFITSSSGVRPGIAIERLTATVVGCGAGLIIALTAWPTRGIDSLPRALARALTAAADDLDSTIRAAGGEITRAAASEPHRTAMLAADEAVRVLQTRMLESLPVRGHIAPLAGLEAAALRLLQEIGALGSRIPKGGLVVPGMDAVGHVLDRALRDIATALANNRAPAAEDDLMAVLDPARDEVTRAEARGDAGAALVAVVDALDAILHTVRGIADDARASADTAGGPSAPWWRRLLPEAVRPA